ncbi:MAG: hypothetical protein JO219_03240 [Candidatus Eremiobacteraeota bacterium]|nr:hypothetical protein [Candidatus Eremiobacteraeota bacterium]MBV8365752.1 hypothetical protein [Candidatus Eremiobacteraeota bacterium]
MSLDALSAIAQIGTFVVIAATAIAALVQLSHLRAANQVASFGAFIREYEGPELRDAFHFVRTQLATRLEDPAFRQQLRGGPVDRDEHPEVAVANFFDLWGGYYREGVIDRTAFMRHNARIVISFWNILEPVVALSVTDGVNTAWEQFEYLAVQAREWVAHHPGGDYPSGMKRIPLVDRWRDADTAGSGPSSR